MAVYPPEVLERGLIAITDEWWANGPSEKEGMMHLFTKGFKGEVS
jgi:hypothetical protein